MTFFYPNCSLQSFRDCRTDDLAGIFFLPSNDGAGKLPLVSNVAPTRVLFWDTLLTKLSQPRFDKNRAQEKQLVYARLLQV